MKSKVIERLLENTNFKCTRKGHKFIFERTKNDGRFIADYQVARNFNEAFDIAKEISSCYKH